MSDNGAGDIRELPAEMRVNPGQLAVAHGAGKLQGEILIIMHRDWTHVPAGVAVAIAKDMIDKAVEGGANVQVQLPRLQVKDAVFQMLIQRFRVILRKKIADGIKPNDAEYLAQRLV